MNKPPPRPRIAEADKSNRRVQAWIRPETYEKIKANARAKGTGWSISKEVGQLLERALSAEPTPAPLDRVAKVREIMEERDVGEATAQMLYDAETAAPPG